MTRVRSLFVMLWALQALTASADLIDQAGLELRLDDNLARAELDRDITSDTSITATATGGTRYQVGDSDRLKLSFELAATAQRRYVGLNNVSAQLTVSHQHRFGLGAYAPELTLSASAGRLQYRDSARTGWLYAANAALHKRFSPRLDMQLSYGFQMRRADDDERRGFPQSAGNREDGARQDAGQGVGQDV